MSLAHVRQMLAVFQDDYNTVSPHSGLTPAVRGRMAMLFPQRSSRCGHPGGAWHGGGGHSRPQSCVDEIEADVGA